MSASLDPRGRPVSDRGGLTITSPGYSGTIESVMPNDIRAVTDDTVELPSEVVEALDRTADLDHRAQSGAIVTITDRDGSSGQGLRRVDDQGGIQIHAPEPPDGQGQVLISTDGHGLVRWHFAKPPTEAAGLRGGLGGRVYEIDAPVAGLAAGPAADRGLIGAAAKVAFKVVVFPIADKLLGPAARFVAEEWEKAHRPYRLRSFLPEDYTQPLGKEITADDIRGMQGKRALLMIHGIMSQSHTGMGRITPGTMDALAKMYERRIIAFDHFTLSHTPKRNLDELIHRLPDDTDLELDVICHSRGGLIARELAEGTPDLGSRKIKVRRVIFAATPNAGTLLADADHMGDLVDKFTNLVTLFPTPGAVDIVETIITVVKHIAVGAFDGLQGLTCMVPGGAYLTELNKKSAKCASEYFAVAANYEPLAGASLTFQARDFLIDRLFNAANDLIVPQEGVYDENGDGSFPIAQPLVFDETKGIQHSTILTAPEFDQNVRQWLA